MGEGFISDLWDMKRFTFPKGERICSKGDVELLFAKAKTARNGTVTLRYTRRDRKDEFGVRVLIVVPKKRIRLAVNRNRIKRQLREIYRQNKVNWHERGLPKNQTLLLAIFYTGAKSAKYIELEEKYLCALTKVEFDHGKQQLNKN